MHHWSRKLISIFFIPCDPTQAAFFTLPFTPNFYSSTFNTADTFFPFLLKYISVLLFRNFLIIFLTLSHFRNIFILCAYVLSCSVMSNSLETHGCNLPGSSIYGDSPGKNTRMGCHALLQGIFPTQGLNLGLTYCRQILYHLSHQGNPRILEWVAYPFSRGSSCPRN